MADNEVHNVEDHSSQDLDTSVSAPPRGSKRTRYTSLACVKCKKRKVKCDGTHPCARCEQTSTECVYIQRHGNDPSHRDSELACMNRKIEMMQHQIGLLTARLPVDVPQIPQPESATPISTKIPGSSGGSQAGIQKDSPARISVRRTQKLARQPQYMGSTSSTFGFEVARKSLQSMGIPTDVNNLDDNGDDVSPSVASFDQRTRNQDPLLEMSRSETLALVASYEEECGSIYPLLNITELVSATEKFYDSITTSQRMSIPTCTDDDNTLSGGIIDVLKLTVAIALAMKHHGPTALSVALLESVESGFEGRLCGNSVDVLEMQAWTLMSILQFNCNQDVLAWRTIGLAGRAVVEMGLHQRETYFVKFHNHQDRLWANKLFWCVYVLDRRYSFATGLPFVINDLDVDVELPEPDDKDSPILKALISYGHIASRVWKVTSRVPKTNNKDHKIEYIHFQVQQWQRSLAPDLQLSPALPDMLAGQSRTRNKIRVLLYLDANQMCLMLYRNTLLSPATISRDLEGSKRAVEVAKDSIRVLDKLHRQSDIFSTQQASFYYYLASGLAVIFLAVCHAPTLFNDTCREEFLLALDLIRHFSANSYVARKLWKSVKHLKVISVKLGILPETEHHDQLDVSNGFGNRHVPPESVDLGQWAQRAIDLNVPPGRGNSMSGGSMSGNQISCQLTNLFEAMDPRYTDATFSNIAVDGGLEIYNYGTTEDVSRSLLGFF